MTVKNDFFSAIGVVALAAFVGVLAWKIIDSSTNPVSPPPATLAEIPSSEPAVPPATGEPATQVSHEAEFIPNIQWDKDNSRALVGNLIRWHVWCDMNNKGEEQNQIHNNIRSVALIQAAGYANPGWNNVGTVQWLQSWKQAVGNDGIRELLTDVGALENRKYAAVLD